MKRALLTLSILILVTMACQLPGVTPLSQPTVAPQAQTNPPLSPVTVNPIPLDGSLESLYQQVIPGVVAIRTGTSLGSGFMFDGEGHVVTNQHVVEGVAKWKLRFPPVIKRMAQ